ncbi:hypothetical protein CEP54_015687 [Fusarium duplospermum]|uniref:DUF6594 domain-containing protein n=1 Tax=Fusarium duplospermum TaxID=1325734 RepID=A0A428NM45_9HYPO|nr:hypothetical protein CEP54_015687 [Fusarium duplospermum]
MDTENGRDGTGFPALAKRIAINPDYEAFIFRKFDRLSARNLLHLESRLTYLEWKLDQADAQASNAQDNETLRSLRTWEAFEENAKDATRTEYTRMKIAEEIRETLKDYRLAEKRLDESNHRDLVAVRRPADTDLLSRFLQDCWIFKVQFTQAASPT